MLGTPVGHVGQHGPREVKVKLALAEMGISITSGCATTFFACIALYACDFLWFKVRRRA